MVTKTAEDFLASVARYSKDNNVPVFAITDRGAYIANSHTQNAAIKNADRYLRRLKPKGVEYSRNESVADKDIDVDKARDHIRKLVALAQPGQSYFLLTNGASAIRNNNVPHIRKLRMAQERWERRNNFDPDEDWRGITKAGAELMKMAAVYKPTLDSIFEVARKLEKSPFRNTEKGHNAFASLIKDSLKRKKEWGVGKRDDLFYLGDRDGHEIYGNSERLKHIAESRFGQTPEHKAISGTPDLTPNGLKGLFIRGFSDKAPKSFNGMSFGSDELDKVISREQIQDLMRSDGYNARSLRDFAKTVNKFDHNKFRQFCEARNLPLLRGDAYHKLGLNDIRVNRFTDSKNSLLASRPFEGELANELPNSSRFTTLYDKHVQKILKDITSGRTLHLVDSAGKPFTGN